MVKSITKNQVATKKKVVKRKAPAKRKTPIKKAAPKRAPKKKASKKKSAKRKLRDTKSLSLHKDGTEQFETSDVLFESVINSVGRPTKYSKALGKKICLLISMGFSLTKITSYSDMPVMSTVCLWLTDEEGKPEFSEWYLRARETQVDIVEDRVMDICMNVPKIPLTVGKDGDVLWMDGERIMVNHPANVALAKLQTDSHYKFLGSLRAKRWGNNIDIGGGIGGLLEMMDVAAGRLASFKEKQGATIDGETGEVVEET